MQTVNQLVPLRSAVDELRRDGKLALVPTMGALHEGHLTLVRAARQHAAHVAVSIFVNPRQFGANEDLSTYPRQLERDSQLLRHEGVSLLWAPTVEAMYPGGYATNISVASVSAGLCGEARPGHFDGVATVVCKLFNQVRPDLALFGEKDWQQLAVIRRMARDLDLTEPAVDQIVGIPTVREADGLAMSSRNAYLSPEERQQAAALPQAMRRAIAQIADGRCYADALSSLRQTLLASGFHQVDYAEVRGADSIALQAGPSAEPGRLFVAARIGTTRLIDNMPLVQPGGIAA